MITKSKANQAILYISLLTFTAFVAYILYINQEVFYTAHNYSEFLYGSSFLNTLLAKPFGLIQYAGAYLTQYLYNSVIGSCLLVAIWGCIFIVGKKAFRLKGAPSAMMLLPVACLLTSVVDLGYWVYIIQIRGYWFSQSVGYLVMLLLLWAARSTPRKWHLLWYAACLLLFPVLGWFALLLALCIILSEKPTWRELIGIVLLLATAPLWRKLLYSGVRLEEVMYGGFPRFVTASDTSQQLSLPFWLLAAVTITVSSLGRYCTKWFVPILSSLAGILLTYSLMYRDSNYINEMLMVRNAEKQNWAEVLRIVEASPKPTTSMVMLKNVALMNEGGLLDRSFKNGNNGNPITADSLHVSFLNIAAPVVYYNYGMHNDSFRLSFECAVQSGFSPFYLKNLARCAKANGEDNLAERYITLLHTHPYYSDWQPENIPDKVKELHDSYSDEISGVENTASYIVSSISQWYEADNKTASEQALFYSMLRSDPRYFWPSLRKYIELHPNDQFPLHAQEAYILYIDKYPEAKRMMLPISEDIYNRYQSFWQTLNNLMGSGVSKKDIPGRMRKDYGDTYWYYFIFYRQIYQSHPIYETAS